MSWVFFVAAYEDRRAAGTDDKYRGETGRRPYPSVGHARRLHRAPRDDHRSPRTTATGTRSPRPPGTASRERPDGGYFERLERCAYAGPGAAGNPWLARLWPPLPLVGDQS